MYGRNSLANAERFKRAEQALEQKNTLAFIVWLSSKPATNELAIASFLETLRELFTGTGKNGNSGKTRTTRLFGNCLPCSSLLAARVLMNSLKTYNPVTKYLQACCLDLNQACDTI